MAMMVNEVIPICQKLGLGTTPERLGTIGTSMGGYGAILLAEKHPDMFAACAAISPAIWTTCEARSANPGAYNNAGQFAEYDAVIHTAPPAGKPLRIASGTDDPFHPGVIALINRLPSAATTALGGGCHANAFFASQRRESLRSSASDSSLERSAEAGLGRSGLSGQSLGSEQL